MATYWLAGVDARLFPPPTRVPATAEAVVIGGGLMGIATAYWLARSGIDVLLIEARQLGWGATGRNAGLMLAGAGPLEDPGLVQSVLRAESLNADYAETGHLALASSAEVWEKICAEAAQRATTSRPLSALDHAACEELLEMRINKRFLGGRWMPHGSTIHPARFVYGLAVAARRYGAAVATQTNVVEVRAIGGRDGCDIRTMRGSIRARHVVFACNSQICEFLPDFRTVITPVRGQVMATQPLPIMFRIGMAVDWGTVYWRQTSDGVVVLGGYRNLDPVAETGSHEQVNCRIQDALAHFLPDTFPDFPPVRVSQRWAGIMDCTLDGRPVVGALPHTRNQWIIAGFGGHGLPAGLGAGKALAEAIAAGRVPSVLEPFAPGRFTEESPIGAAHTAG